MLAHKILLSTGKSELYFKISVRELIYSEVLPVLVSVLIEHV